MNVPTDHLDTTLGYLALGMHQDAWDELESLPPELKADVGVIELRIEILQLLGKWESARVLAESLAKQFPDYSNWWLLWAYALRREQCEEAAQSVLREARAIHPDVGMIAYNLACYACVLGNLEETRTLLQIAFPLDPSLRKTALDDPDLEPLWIDLGKQPANPSPR
jgi:tetratricopeptide (TPR) repeat protein